MSLPARTTNQEHALRSPASSTETFTNNNSLLHLAIDNRGSASSRPGPPPPADLSNTLAIIAEQLQHASRTIAAAHASLPRPGADANQQHHLAARLDELEQAQERLAVELAGLRSLHAGKSRDELLPSAAAAAGGSSLAELESRLAEVQAAHKLE